MSGNGKSLEQRVIALERWRDEQITRDTLTVTRMDEQFDAVNVGLDEIRASIGDLDGRSVASRLISMGVDIGNLAVRQDAVESRLTAVETRLDGMDTRLDGMDTRLEGMDTRLEGMDGRLETVASGVTEILQILRNP